MGRGRASTSVSIGNSNIWRVGATATPAGGFFDGPLDDVRVYDRALARRVQNGHEPTRYPPPGQDAAPPTAPGNLTATVGTDRATLSWNAATDNRGVTHYNVHRGSTSGFTPTAANRIAQPTGTGYADTNIVAGVYYYKVTAEDTAGNVGPASNQASAVARHDAALRPGNAHGSGRGEQSRFELGRRYGRRGRRALRRPSRDERRLHSQHREPHRAAAGHELRRYRPPCRNVLLQGHRSRPRR